jgi:hypothetical protein
MREAARTGPCGCAGVEAREAGPLCWEFEAFRLDPHDKRCGVVKPLHCPEILCSPKVFAARAGQLGAKRGAAGSGLARDQCA